MLGDDLNPNSVVNYDFLAVMTYFGEEICSHI